MANLESSLYYDPSKTYYQNVQEGPYGELAKGEKYQTLGQPQRLFLDQPVHLDLGISAGPLVNGRAVKAALDLGWDIVTYKTARSREYGVNGFPNLLPTELHQLYTSEIAENGVRVGRSFSFPGSPTNSFGVPSLPPDIWLPDATEAVNYANLGQVVVVSFQGTPSGNVDAFVRNHAETAVLAKKTGAEIIECNMSCPNEGSAHLLCLDPETSGNAVRAMREEVGDDLNLLVKMCYYNDQELLRHFVQAVGPFVDGFTAINTMAANILDHDSRPAFGEGREKAGISGEYIRPYGLDMVSRLIHLREDLSLDYEVVGVGGVFNKQHYDAYKAAGAIGVETATGSLANPRLALEIKSQLGLQVVRA